MELSVYSAVFTVAWSAEKYTYGHASIQNQNIFACKWPVAKYFFISGLRWSNHFSFVLLVRFLFVWIVLIHERFPRSPWCGKTFCHCYKGKDTSKRRTSCTKHLHSIKSAFDLNAWITNGNRVDQFILAIIEFAPKKTEQRQQSNKKECKKWTCLSHCQPVIKVILAENIFNMCINKFDCNLCVACEDKAIGSDGDSCVISWIWFLFFYWHRTN